MGFTTSAERDHVMVDLKLSIGQCKVIERLLDQELWVAESGTSTFSENALKGLIDVFMAKTTETEAERQARFSNWVGGLQLVTGEHHG